MEMKKRHHRQYYLVQTSKRPGSKKQYRLKILFQREAIALVQSELNKNKSGGGLFFLITETASTGKLKRKMKKAITHIRGNLHEEVLASKNETLYEDGKDVIYVRILEAEHMCELIFTGTGFELLEHFVEPLLEVAKEYIIKPDDWELLSEIWN